MCFASRDGTKLVESRVYSYLNGHHHFYIAKSNKFDRTLIIDITNESGEASIQLTNITTGEVKFAKDVATNRYLFRLYKGSTYQISMNFKQCKGSLNIRLSTKDIKLLRVDDYHYINDKVLFHFSGDTIYMYKDHKDNNVGMAKNYQERCKKPLKLMKNKSIEYAYYLSEDVTDEELVYLLETIYKSNRVIYLYCYDEDFIEKHFDIINKYHLDVLIKPSMEELKPDRPYVVH